MRHVKMLLSSEDGLKWFYRHEDGKLEGVDGTSILSQEKLVNVMKPNEKKKMSNVQLRIFNQLLNDKEQGIQVTWVRLQFSSLKHFFFQLIKKITTAFSMEYDFFQFSRRQKNESFVFVARKPEGNEPTTVVLIGIGCMFFLLKISK